MMDELLKSVYEQPELWATTEHTFYRGHFHVRVNQGKEFIAPTKGVSQSAFGRRDRTQWWKAYQWWLKNAPAETLTKENK